ncbi:MAG: universal stress protein [Anaerolineae bacterium]|nr:universal stress protein [Anaerolineae bacterium]
MGKILCATRGGEAAQRTQDAAIALAKERGDSLLFLFVADVHFLNHTEHPVRPDVVQEEMVHMGEFLLAMAQERAQQQGVPASFVVRQGNLVEQLKAVAVEEGASLVVLGRPSQEGGLFRLEELEALAAEIQRETGVETRIL